MVPKNWALLLKSRFIAAGRIFKWKVTKFWLIKMHSMMLGMNWNHYFFSKEVFLQCKNWTLFAEFALIWRKNLLMARTVCHSVKVSQIFPQIVNFPWNQNSISWKLLLQIFGFWMENYHIHIRCRKMRCTLDFIFAASYKIFQISP